MQRTFPHPVDMGEDASKTTGGHGSIAAIMSAVPAPDLPSTQASAAPRWRWLPAIGTWKYHLLLLFLGVFILGPLGGVTASYMNFSLGFFVGGQVLAGLLGSTVTIGYGAEGKHGANYIQTAAASVAGMSAMGVLIQAMVWMGLPQPPMWQLVLYMLCIGMFGVGVGMLFTPVLVDRMRLSFPSGLAVANILRALTDPVLLKRAVGMLGSGVGIGIAGGVAAGKIALIGATGLSTSTFGAGMITGARIGIPAVTAGLLGLALVPTFVGMGWLAEGDPPRKIAFLIALGMIMGAAIIDMTLLLILAIRRWRSPAPSTAAPQEEWQRVDTWRLAIWVLFWGAATVATGHLALGQPVGYLALAVGLVSRRPSWWPSSSWPGSACTTLWWASWPARYCWSPPASRATCSKTARPAGGSARTASCSSATKWPACSLAPCWRSSSRASSWRPIRCCNSTRR